MENNRFISVKKIALILLGALYGSAIYGQHETSLSVELDSEKKTLNINHTLIFHNQSNDTLKTLLLNDWTHSYSSKSSPLAKRFSDEFYIGFHLASDMDRGATENITIIDANSLFLSWKRTKENPDLVEVQLRDLIEPNQKTTLHLTYTVKIPNQKFTKFGFTDANRFDLKNWFLVPARYENHSFVKYSNLNLDDAANALSNYQIELKTSNSSTVTSDLTTVDSYLKGSHLITKLTGNRRSEVNLVIAPEAEFESYKNNALEVVTNLEETKLSTVQKAIVISRIVTFTNELIGSYPHHKILVTQTDYERNPFYGLNQLPSIIRPFTDEFIYEIKFLKTYLNTYLKNSIHLDSRKDNWIYDGIQVYTMMKYIDKYHPESKMLGSASNLKLLKSYHLTNLDFNEQYSYFYMLIARKNLDQPLNSPKNTLIKFNEQIAGKYRAGISLRYLDDFLGNQSVERSIQNFYQFNQTNSVSASDFVSELKKNTQKDINWFFEVIINSREIIDYKFLNVSKTKDSVSFSINNKTGVTVPIPVYGLKKGEVVFKKWIDSQKADSVFVFERKNADKIVLNYNNEVPEYNLRNNWKSIKGIALNNRPIKFNFMKDLEDPYYNQIIYVPTLSYNLYDGLSPGIRLHNKTILDKPFTFDINPVYSTIQKSLTGAFQLAVNQNNRDLNLYNIKYSMNGYFFHYAPNASYLKLNPMVQLRIRENDFRENRKQLILFRQVMVNREQNINATDTDFIENYSVFDAKYYNTKTDIINHFSIMSDLQISSSFGKAAVELEYRKLFEDNRQVNLRFFAGKFLYNHSNSDFYSFAVDRPTDYLFDYNFYGISESTGFFSQQFIMAEGGFKSKLNTKFANQWITTFNGSFNVWNWIEVYGDIGLIKNSQNPEKFIYGSGIRLNLVTDYFELYFPVYSNNGWEISQNQYKEKIRFVITLNPKILVNLFTRKWF